MADTNKSKKRLMISFFGLSMRWNRKNRFKNLWSENDDRVFAPKYFGISCILNFHALLKSTGLVESKTPLRDLNSLPADLPAPKDDGACDHLFNAKVPNIVLRSTGDREVELAKQSLKPTVLFFYPRTGVLHKPATAAWDLIPGAPAAAHRNHAASETFTLSSRPLVTKCLVSARRTPITKKSLLVETISRLKF